MEYILEKERREKEREREKRWMPVVLLPLPRWDETNEWIKCAQCLLIVNETDVSHNHE
jgi:hypothetical protein